MFNKNLKRLRAAGGLSQKQVADYLGISPQSISKWEKGEALPSIEYLPKLSEILDCDINAFFLPCEKAKYDIDKLKEIFDFIDEWMEWTEKDGENFFAFIEKRPRDVDIIEKLAEELKQHQTLKFKTIKSILGCTDSDTSYFIDRFIKHGIIEKMEGVDTYFVIKDNIDGVVVITRYLNDSTIVERNVKGNIR